MGPGGCYNTFSYGNDEERQVVFDIGWFIVMGREVRQYKFMNRDGGRMSLVVLVRQNRYEGEDLEIWLWDWSEQEKSLERNGE